MSPCPDCDGPGRAELERSAKELAAAGCVLAADLEEWLVVLAGRAPADSRESLKGWWDAFTRFAPVTPAVTLEWVDGPFVAGPRREESSETPRTTSAGAKPPSSNPCDCNPYHSAVCALAAAREDAEGWQENAEDAARQIVGARAERDAAIAALREADELLRRVDPFTGTFAMGADSEDLWRADVAAWRALPGCCDRPVPEGETT